MRLVLASIVLTAAIASTASADPLAINPDAFALSQNAATAATAKQDADTRDAQNYPSTRHSQLGGGFIEFLFGGSGGREATSDQPPASQQSATSITASRDGRQAYQTQSSDPSESVALTEGYAPSSQGDMDHPQMDPKFERQLVAYDGKEAAGTIIVDTPHKFLFLVQNDGKALRYGIGVGRPGFTWAGIKTVTAKREWPDWVPPSEMIQRRPDLPRYMAGGPENPLGARALYLGSTLYRIHGSNEPWTIGTNVSSGCIRMRNADVIDLFDRVKVGTKVVVI